MSSHAIKRSNILALVLLVFASSAMIGEILKMPTLKGLGLASCAAPFTKVFCHAQEYQSDNEFETFAAEFTLNFQTPRGEVQSIKITPEIYRQLKGSYQRRNVYGAILAYGPAFSQEVQQKTFHYAIESPGTIRKELGIPDDAIHITVKMTSKSKGIHQSWTLKGLKK
ncbi:MAG: hypothetical protein ACSHX0_00720 [Akkermansiaceae bacterium]